MAPSSPETRQLRLYLALVVGSCCLSVYELSLLRFSAATFNIYFNVFAMAVSLLGFGVGGGLASRFAGDSARDEGSIWISTSLCAAGLALSLSLLLPVMVPLGSILSLVLALCAMSGPCICWGVCLGVLYRERGGDAGHLYGANMAGAALGLFLGMGLMALLNGPLLVIMLIAAALACCGFLLHRLKRNAAMAMATLVVITASGMYLQWDQAPITQWSPDGYFLGNTLSRIIKPSGSIASLETKWDTLHRTDLVGLKSGQGNFRLIFTDGALTGSMPGNPGTRDTEWLRKEFILAALPILAIKPDSFLSISSGGGLELRIASDAGASVVRGIEPNRAIKTLLERSNEFTGNLPGRKGIDILYDDVRHVLRKDTALYDAVFLSLREPVGLPWTGIGLGESLLTTREAFEEYWRHLKPGGMLIMTFAREPLLVRALFTIGDVMGDGQGRRTKALKDSAWGFQLAPSAIPGGSGYNYLLMVMKDVPDGGLAKTVLSAYHNMPVIALFGPGITTANTYAWLNEDRDLQEAGALLTGDMKTRSDLPLDLRPAKDLKPFFLIVVQRIDPYTRWALGLGLLLLVLFFLFPLSSSRPLDASGSCDRPPLPVYLFYFVFLGSGVMMTESAVVQFSTLIAGNDRFNFIMPLGAFLLGIGIGSIVFQKILFAHKMRLFISSLLAAIALLALGFLVMTMPDFPYSGWGGIASPVFSLVVGLCLGAAFPLGITALSRMLPALIPWAWASYSFALVIGMVLVQWIAPFLGWGGVWAGALLCHASVLLLGTLLWRPSAILSSLKTT